jgi:citrate lyase subunit alpha/citrate CoA-transferase
MKNPIGKEIPDYIEGYGKVEHYRGPFETPPKGLKRQAPPVKMVRPGEEKLLSDLEEAFKIIPIKDGMTLSFITHLRNGDNVINMALDTAARLGIKDLKIASSGIFPVHEPMIEHIKNGVVTGLDLNGVLGPVAQYISQGNMKNPVILRTHGGRARAIECGQMHIDVAFYRCPRPPTDTETSPELKGPKPAVRSDMPLWMLNTRIMWSP